jgi:nuclease-like protein
MLIAMLALLAILIAWRGIGLRGVPLIAFELGAIGAICAELQTNGWHAIHDVSLGHGNVDHILVGPGDIFTIETKSHRGRIPLDRTDPKMLRQAYAQKKLLERITGREVQSLLVFSQAYLVGSVPAQRKRSNSIAVSSLRFRIPELDSGKWRGPESNRRHHDFQSCALPTELPRLVAGAMGRAWEG